MPELLIKKSTTIAGFEELLATPRLGEHTLVVPNSISHAGAMGCAMAFTQFLLTWSRSSSNREIRTFLSPSDDDGHARFVQRIHGFAAAYYGRSLAAEGDSGEDIRRPLMRAARNRILAMHRADLGTTSRGSEIEMIFVSGAKHEFHGSLYSKAPNSAELADPESHGRLVRNKNDLNRFLENCFRALNVNTSEVLKRHLLRTDLPFGSLLAEAFRNTAEHACSDPRGSKLEKNMRCVRVSRTQIARDWIESFNVGAPGARSSAEQYFTALAARYGARSSNNVDVVEISIFDSGKGFSRTMGASKALGDESDLELVRKCFLKHQSAKSQSTSGVGMYRILSAVSALGGFMRVRTSTAEAFYGGAENDTVAADPSSFVHGGMAPVEGTLITVGIPIVF
jgi:hypothetical protein